ncbi:F-box protein CPR1 [Linum perenne]
MDSIIEILTRLPVKSLIRFRCVSKSFNTLISSTQFVKHHLKHLKSSPDQNPLFLLIPSTSKRLGYCSCALHSLYSNLPHPNFADLDHSQFLAEPDMKPHMLVGSSDGLLCLAIKRQLVMVVALWNPSTRVFSTLPSFDDHLPNNQSRRRYMVFGFGYDHLSDDYKVVSISCYPNKEANTITAAGIVQVCSIKSRIWKRLDDFKYGLPCDYPGKCVNNTLNWLMDNDSGSIVSLDLHTETYREVMQPEFANDINHQKTIGVLEDCLCVMYHRHDEYSDLWVMKEFGVMESWTKLFRIDIRQNNGLRSLQYFMPVHVCGDKALLWLWSGLAIYNYEDGSVLYRSSEEIWCCQLYMESLVSPELDRQP